MIETGHFKANGNSLSYSIQAPETSCSNVGIIFIHAADGSSLGPHRMFVELADRFVADGFAVLRFDFPGCGDSTGTDGQADIRDNIKDVIEVINFFKKNASIDSVILFGISRGAYIAYTAMVQRKLPLAGLILLSTPVSSSKAGLRSVRSRLREYLFKLGQIENVKRLVKGQISFSYICKTLAKSLFCRSRYAQSQSKNFQTKCSMLFIYGSNDPIVKTSRQYYAEKCRQNSVIANVNIIANANHSFFHYQWKDEIYQICSRWLAKNSRSKI